MTPRSATNNSTNLSKIQRWIVPLLTLAGFALATAAFLIARQSEIRHARAEFRRLAELHYSALEVELQRNLESLAALRSIFEATPALSREAFRSLANDMTASHPEIQVLEWAPRVAGSGRVDFESASARDLPGFMINDRDTEDRPFRAAERAEYYPLLYVEPVDENRLVIGFDAAMGKAARQLEHARDNGKAMVSGVVLLPQSGKTPGLIVTVPVYAPSSPTSVAERRERIRGVIRGVFRVNDLMKTAWNRLPPGGLDTMVLDQHATGSSRFVYFHNSGVRDERAAAPSEAEMRKKVHHQVTASIAGREWRFLYRPVPEWWRAQRTWHPVALLLAGSGFTLMLAAYVRSVMRRAAVIERVVGDRTARLAEANEMLSEEVAARRRTEEELRQSERRLIEAQRIGRIGSWEADLTRGSLHWSDEVYRIFGRTAATFQPSNEAFFAAIHPEDRVFVERASSEALASGQPYHIEHRILRPDGTERTVVEHAELVCGESGEVVRMIGTVQDVTEQKQVQQKLALERNLLESIIESMPDLVFVKDQGGRYLRVNSATAKALGKNSAAEVLGRTDADLLAPDVASMYMADDAAVMHSGEPLVNREEPLASKEGGERWLLTTKVPFRDANGKVAGVVGVSRDITERRREEADRRGMERKFQETQKLESLGVLAGGIAHDFNNLLTGILGNATLARMDLPPESPIHAYLSQIETSSQRAADLCRQMLAYSGKGRFVIQAVDLSALVRETLHLLQLSVSKKAVLKLELAPELPCVMGDTTQLRQIVMNLVINASEAIGERSGAIVVRTSRIRADRQYLADLDGGEALTPGDYVVLEVTDNGSGMNAETAARMFEPFFTTKFTGRGLGLSAVLGIVRGHKGGLKVHSQEGSGTTFKLLLPAVAAQAPGPTEPRISTITRGAGNLLIADDEEAVRTVLGRMCSNMGFQVFTATDGAHALEIYRTMSSEIDAVLLDLTMPRMDGEEALREIRRINPNAYVLLMSGFNEQEAMARFVGKGLAGFVQKPFTPDQLRQKMSDFFSDPGI